MTVQQTLFKKDSGGRTRVWSVSVEGDKYWVESGLLIGEKVTTTPKVALPKNIGKKNATTGEEQALVEAEALVTKQLAQGGYFRDVADIDNKTFFDVMLATGIEKIKKLELKGSFSQPKLDGVRCALQIDQAMSRQGKPFASVQHIRDAFAEYFKQYPDHVIDGELYNHDLREDFNEIISIVRKQNPEDSDIERSIDLVQYHVYDVYRPEEPDATFSERNEWIQTKILGIPYVRIVRTVPIVNQEELDGEYAAYLEQGYEGQMIRLNVAYENKRSKNLIKRKEFLDEEYEILEIVEGTGNWSGVAKSIKGRMLSDGVTFDSGIRGNKDHARKLLEEKDSYVGTEATVRYMNRTPAKEDGTGNKPRFPVTVAFWKGKRDV